MNIQEIKDPKQLLEENENQKTYVFDNFIKVNTMGERSRSKRKLKLLKVVDAEIQNIIDEDESVYFVTDGVLINAFEQLFIGWVAYYYNLTAFVFTTKRVLLIHIKNRKTRGVFLRSIEYADIKAVRGSVLSGFKIQLRNGKTLTFSRVPGADRKELGNFLNQILDTKSPKDPNAIGMRNLCPNCLTDYGEVLVPECRNCGLEFKKPGKAALLSLLMPGLGDLYLGSKALGLLELLFMSMIWLSFLGTTISETAAGVPIVGSLVMLIFIWMFIHPIDAVKSYHMGSKGLFPVQPPAAYGTVEQRIIDDPIVPKKEKRSKAKIFLLIPAGMLVAIILFFVIIGTLAESGVIPSGEVTSGTELPDNAFQKLMEFELINESSEIIYIYGSGFLSYLESGTILTDDSLTTYYHDENGELQGYYLDLSEIKDVVMISEGSTLEDSLYQANRYDEEQWIQFFLPAEGDGDELFITELTRRIQQPQN